MGSPVVVDNLTVTAGSATLVDALSFAVDVGSERLTIAGDVRGDQCKVHPDRRRQRLLRPSEPNASALPALIQRDRRGAPSDIHRLNPIEQGARRVRRRPWVMAGHPVENPVLGADQLSQLGSPA